MRSRPYSRSSRSWTNDLHVQHAEKSAAKAEPERPGRLGLVVQRGVVQTQLRKSLAKGLEVVGIGWEHSGVHLGPHFLEPRQWPRRRTPLQRQRVAYGGALDVLDTGDDESDLSGAERVLVLRLRRENAQLVDLVCAAGGHDADLGAKLQPARNDPHERHHPEIVVEPGVDDQRLQRAVGIAARRRDARNQGFEQIRDALAGLGADQQRIVGLDADDVLDLVHHPLRVGARQVDLVEHRQHLEPLVDGRVAVGDALRLDALGGIDHQQRALAGRQRAGHLVGEVHVPRRIDEIQLVLPSVARAVVEAHALGLDGDAALALQIHRIEHLVGHLAIAQPAANLDETVGERRLAVIDVGDDGEISYVIHRLRSQTIREWSSQ